MHDNDTRTTRFRRPHPAARRRKFLKQAGAAALVSLVPDAVRQAAWAAGSDAPEKTEIRVGYPLHA